MKFIKAELEIGYLKDFDVVLMNSIGDASLNDGTGTTWNDDDFGFDD